MPMRTERLALRPWRRDEAERLYDIRRRPDVAQWLGDPAPWTSIETASAQIVEWEEQIRSEPPLGAWAIVPDVSGTPAGTASLSKLPDSPEYHIGWNLHPDSVGMGYASESARAVLDHAFAHQVSRVWAIMWPHNDASARVAARSGMEDLGVRVDPWYGSDEEPNSRMFRLDRPEPLAEP